MFRKKKMFSVYKVILQHRYGKNNRTLKVRLKL